MSPREEEKKAFECAALSQFEMERIEGVVVFEIFPPKKDDAQLWEKFD
jgi:hypothetical protein